MWDTLAWISHTRCGLARCAENASAEARMAAFLVFCQRVDSGSGPDVVELK